MSTRAIIIHPAYGGAACPATTQSQDCNEYVFEDSAAHFADFLSLQPTLPGQLRRIGVERVVGVLCHLRRRLPDCHCHDHHSGCQR